MSEDQITLSVGMAAVLILWFLLVGVILGVFFTYLFIRGKIAVLEDQRDYFQTKADEFWEVISTTSKKEVAKDEEEWARDPDWWKKGGEP